jgi:hypothetical protein
VHQSYPSASKWYCFQEGSSCDWWSGLGSLTVSDRRPGNTWVLPHMGSHLYDKVSAHLSPPQSPDMLSTTASHISLPILTLLYLFFVPFISRCICLLSVSLHHSINPMRTSTQSSWSSQSDLSLLSHYCLLQAGLWTYFSLVLS